MRALRWWLVAVVLLFAGGSVAHAQGVDPTREPAAQLRFVHGIPAGTPVDIYLGEALIVSALPSAQATAYGLVKAGEHTLTFRAVRSGPQGAVLASLNVNLVTGHSYTLALAPREGQRVAFLYDDETGSPPDGRGSLRLVNLRPAGERVAGALGEAALTPLLPFGEASERVAVSGEGATMSIVSEQGQLLRESPAIPLRGADFYTLFLLGNGPTLQTLIVSYPLSDGAAPQSPSWVPLGELGSSAAGIRPQPGNMPTAGMVGEQNHLALWLVIDGLLLMAVALMGKQWWQQRRS